MHGMTEKKSGLRAALRSLFGALLASAPQIASAADDPPPMVLAKTGYFFAGGKIDANCARLADDRADVCRILHPEDALPPLPDRDDPRRQPDRHQLHRHAGRPRRLGAVFRAPRPRRLRGRPGGARPRRAFLAVAGQGRRRQPQAHRAALRRPRALQPWPQAKHHTQWPGAGKPGDPAFDQFYASQFPSLVDFPTQQRLNRDAGIALLDKIGPAVLLTHSQSGTFHWPIADARPNLVKAIIAVEPNGPPVYETEFKGAPEWFADMGKKKSSGLGEVPLTYDPPLKDGEELAFVKQDKPDKPDLVRCWQQQEPARKLKNLAGIPIAIVMSEASYHASYDHCTANYLTQAGVANTMIKLGETGIKGNGHMMMLEKNSDDIAAVMRDWLLKAVPPKS